MRVRGGVACWKGGKGCVRDGRARSEEGNKDVKDPGLQLPCVSREWLIMIFHFPSV